MNAELIEKAVASQASASPRMINGRIAAPWTSDERALLLAAATEYGDDNGHVPWLSVKDVNPPLLAALTRDGSRTVTALNSQLTRIHNRSLGVIKRRVVARPRRTSARPGEAQAASNPIPAHKPVQSPKYCPHCGGALEAICAAMNL